MLRRAILFSGLLAISSATATEYSRNTVTGRQNFGKTPGNEHGYSSLDGLVFRRFSYDHVSPFLDVRGHHLNDGNFAANIGGGFRANLEDRCIGFGMNAYYDYRGYHSHSLNQVGVGAEIFGLHWSINANGYIPVGRDQVQLFHCRFDYPGGFFMEKNKTATLLGGADLRFGFRFPNLPSFSSTLEVGPYFYRDFFGVLGSYTMQVTNYMRFKFGVTHDRVFGTKLQGEVALTISWGGGKKGRKNCDDFYRPIPRAEILPVFKCCRWETNF
ncbi:MAG: inverse autotransporter beta domain-containing protein [Verrucomicrobia bacterium]|nr:inverse autotransporter beta domain-containing protein [Verrucomicrobiota bacterium]